jgi:hypothetical protein
MGIFMSIFTKFIRQPRRKPVPASLISEPLGFLNLPPEIRSNIYDLLLVAPNGIMNCSHKDFKPHPQILRVCQQIHVEASPILYSRNQFHLVLQNLRAIHSGRHGWTNCGARNINGIRRLNIDSYPAPSLWDPFYDEQVMAAGVGVGPPVLNFTDLTSQMGSLESLTLRCWVKRSSDRPSGARDMTFSCMTEVAQKTRLKMLVEVPPPDISSPGHDSCTMRLMSSKGFRLLPQVRASLFESDIERQMTTGRKSLSTLKKKIGCLIS